MNEVPTSAAETRQPREPREPRERRERRGHCLCGAVQFMAVGEPRWVAHCHCESCRRTTSSPMTTYAGFETSQVSWAGTPRATYISSPGVQRSFCPRCGTPVSFSGERWPGEVHLFVVSFDEPASFTPRVHVHAGDQLPWLQLHDGLPRYHSTPREGPPLP